MIIKPFAQAGGYTVFDNAILDLVMPACKPNTWKVVCATLRKTVGWSVGGDPNQRKKEDQISFSQFHELTGIKGRSNLSNAIQDALERGYIKRKPAGKQTFTYSLNREFEIEIPDHDNQSRIGTGHESGPATGPETVPETGPESGHTKQTVKPRGNKERGAGETPPASPAPKKKRERDERLDHPAIQKYRDVVRRHVPVVLRDSVIAAVDQAPEVVEKWEKHLRAWVGHGYNPGNIDGILDSFKNGGIKNGNGHRSAPPLPASFQRKEYPQDAVAEYHRLNPGRPISMTPEQWAEYRAKYPDSPVPIQPGEKNGNRSEVRSTA